jgi:hypothetical protein
MFFTFTFVGSKLRNQLNTHLHLIFKMYMQEFFKMTTFHSILPSFDGMKVKRNFLYDVEM